MRRMLTVLALCLTVTPLAARAAPRMPPPGMMGRHPGPRMDRAQREKMLRKVHTMAVLELGDLLNLSTDDTIRLADRLRRFDDQRVQLQLANFDAMQGLKRAAAGQGGDAAALAKRVADNRVQLAKIDRQELDELLKGLNPQQTAKVALFLARFPQRIEFIARQARMHRMMEEGGPMRPPPPAP